MIIKYICCRVAERRKALGKMCPLRYDGNNSCVQTECAWYISKKDKCAIWVYADTVSANKKSESKKN